MTRTGNHHNLFQRHFKIMIKKFPYNQIVIGYQTFNSRNDNFFLQRNRNISRYIFQESTGNSKYNDITHPDEFIDIVGKGNFRKVKFHSTEITRIMTQSPKSLDGINIPHKPIDMVVRFCQYFSYSCRPTSSSDNAQPGFFWYFHDYCFIFTI